MRYLKKITAGKQRRKALETPREGLGECVGNTNNLNQAMLQPNIDPQILICVILIILYSSN